jgi:hypothetical protein
MSPSRVPEFPHLRRIDWGVAVLLAVATIGLTQARPDVPHLTGQFHDDGLYVITAKALAEGQGYRLVHLPSEPLQTKYPPLYPAALAVLWKLDPDFPRNVRLLEWVGVLGAAVASAGGYLYAVRFGYAPRVVAASAAFVVVTSPIYQHLAVLLMAELPFAALLLLGLWRLERALNDPDRLAGFWLGVVLALPALCRMPGIVLPFVGLLLLLRAGRRPWLPTIGMAVILAPWVVWSAAAAGQYHSDPITGYYLDYVGWWSDVGTANLAQVALQNLTWILQATADQPAAGLAAADGGTAVEAAAVFLGLAAWIGVARDAFSGRSAAWFLIGYLGLILVWPWPPARFVIPILPVLTVYLFRPLARLPAARWVILVAGGSVLVANLTALTGHWERIREKGYEAAMIRVNDPNWNAYMRLFDWIRENIPQDSLVGSQADPVVYLYTGRKGFNPFVAYPARLYYRLPGEGLSGPTELTERLRLGGAAFAVTIPVAGLHDPFLERFDRLAADGILTRVYVDPTDHRLAVYRLNPPPLNAPAVVVPPGPDGR